MAQRIARPATAFTVTRQRRPRVKAGKHLDFIRKLRCLECGTHNNIHAAHIRTPAPMYGKRATGMQEKPDDRWTLPICVTHHVFGPEAQHTMSEEEYWRRLGINPFVIAMALWGCTGDEDTAEQIIVEAMSRTAQVSG